MTREERQTGGVLVFLSVGCGISLQLLLIRNALMLAHAGAAFVVLGAHIAGWGFGLGLHRVTGAVPRRAARAASLAAAVAWIGTALIAGPGIAVPLGGGATTLTAATLVSGVFTGISISAALAVCTSPLIALGADLAGIGAGALVHVVLTSWLPGVPSPVPWLAGFAMIAAPRVPRLVWPAAAVSLLLVPLSGPEILARAPSPLGKALRTRGLESWAGSFYDHDGRVDAVSNPEHGGVELFINGATQAQTPSGVHDRVMLAIIDLVKPRSAAVLGAGGLADVATLVSVGVEAVAAVERSEAVLRGARTLAPAARRLFYDPRVDVIHGEARRFVADHPARYDLVLLPLAYSRSGVSPAALTFFPAYLFTVEGVETEAEAVTRGGAVCFVLPTHELRDRILATIGRIESSRGSEATLGKRLWVAENPGKTAYAHAACWAPHEPLNPRASTVDLKVLHDPRWPVSRALGARLAGMGTLPPVEDARPYFFDLETHDPADPASPAAASGLLWWVPVSLVLVGLLVSRPPGGQGSPPGPRATHVAVACLTGFAFPALEHVSLSVARAAGLPEGIAYAAMAVTFAVAGIVAMLPLGGVSVRALVAAIAMLGAGSFLGLGGPGRLFTLSEVAAACAGLGLMAVLMVACVGPFVGLFRAERERSDAMRDVRPLFWASALGTLAGLGPILMSELRWGGMGSAVVGGTTYLVAAGVIRASRKGKNV